jgi:excisionase family DNA binding protein
MTNFLNQSNICLKLNDISFSYTNFYSKNFTKVCEIQARYQSSFDDDKDEVSISIRGRRYILIEEDMLLNLIRKVVNEELEADTNDSFDDYLTRQEIADIMGVTKNTIDTWARIGKISKIRVGNQVRYSRSSILEKNVKKHRRNSFAL